MSDIGKKTTLRYTTYGSLFNFFQIIGCLLIEKIGRKWQCELTKNYDLKSNSLRQRV